MLLQYMGKTPELPEQNNFFNEYSKSVGRRNSMNAWLGGLTPPTEDELNAMPRFLGSNTEISKQRWLILHRQSQMTQFLSGEGESPVDGKANFGGKSADLRTQYKSARRKSALLRGLSGDDDQTDKT